MTSPSDTHTNTSERASAHWHSLTNARGERAMNSCRVLNFDKKREEITTTAPAPTADLQPLCILAIEMCVFCIWLYTNVQIWKSYLPESNEAETGKANETIFLSLVCDGTWTEHLNISIVQAALHALRAAHRRQSDVIRCLEYSGQISAWKCTHLASGRARQTRQRKANTNASVRERAPQTFVHFIKKS